MDNTQILKEIAVQILGFAVVFLILRKLAWSKLLGAIDARRGAIERSFSELDQKKHDLETLEKTYRDKIEHIEQEARAKIQEAANVGVALARDIQERARLDAQKTIERAKAEIEQDLVKAKILMRREIVELSSLMTEKVISQRMDAKEHERLVEQFLKELEKVS